MNLKYTVDYMGRTMTLSQYAAISGVPLVTLQQRARKGQPIIHPNDERNRRTRAAKQNMRRAAPYTEDEISELYAYFAGQADELQILMDFTLLPEPEARELLKKLQYRRIHPCLY